MGRYCQCKRFSIKIFRTNKRYWGQYSWLIWTLNSHDKSVMGNKSWYSVNKRGDNCLEYRPYVDYYQWLSPFSHDAREYVKSNISIASIEGIASVHLDYVRFL